MNLWIFFPGVLSRSLNQICLVCIRPQNSAYIKCSSVLMSEKGTFEGVSSVEGSAFFPVELTLTVESVFYTVRFFPFSHCF